MKVKDVIASALRLIGRSELVSDLSAPSKSKEKDCEEVVETLVYCFNAVEDELSRKYIPLITREEMSSEDNRFYYSDFGHYPVKIKRVYVRGKETAFEVFAKYMEVKAREVTVEYGYAPTRKELDGESDYDGDVGEYLIALGIASEYSLLNGEAEMADRWEKAYRAQLDKIQRSLQVCARIPPRRWV